METVDIVSNTKGQISGVLVRKADTVENSVLEAKGLFYGIGHSPNSQLLEGQVDLDTSGYVLVEEGTAKTSVEGVFAAGDVQDHEWRQAITAAGSGCIAALSVERYLASNNLLIEFHQKYRMQQTHILPKDQNYGTSTSVICRLKHDIPVVLFVFLNFKELRNYCLMNDWPHDDQSKDARTSYFNMPALDVSIAFPQATPASIFPPAVSDYYHFDDLLTPVEQAMRLKARECMEKEVAPIMTKYWEKAEFPFEVVPKLGALCLAGSTIKGYGCPGLSITGSAIATAEVSRVDASCSTFILVHSLAMLTIGMYGSSAQKEKYLPSLAKLKTIGCWALTEPDYGSDAISLKTTATKVAGGWILEGQKRWIGNSTFADILVIFARNTSTNQINAYLVMKDAPGLQATKIENKMGLRMVQNGDILLKKVFVPDEDRLPGVNSFQETDQVLATSRVLVAWQPIGISMGVYDMCHRYLNERKQFGAPLAAFQINQQKLVHMLGNVQAMVLTGWRLCKLFETGKMTGGQSSLGKSWITTKAREVVSLGRELLGGNGILTDFLVAKAFCDLEPIYTYEGTHEINSLVTGKEITGIGSFKAAVTRSRM